MTTTLNTSCSENTMVLSEDEGFCMHVFSSLVLYVIYYTVQELFS
jgi:hypothetical protein